MPTADYVANANWTRGKHNVRFGIDVARQANNNWEVAGGGSFSFSGSSTSLNGGPSPNQFNTFADYLLGYTSAATNSFMQGMLFEFREVPLALKVRARDGLAETEC